MKDGTGEGEPAEVSRPELYGAYVNFYRELCAEVGPCRDDRLLSSAAQYLLTEPEPGGAFTVFPFYQAVSDGPDGPDGPGPGPDCRKHLCAFIKATELLETLCVNLFLQPWKKEIRSVKTFTGSFVYCLLPVLSSFTIKSVLASIGYLPHGDTPSEFRLSEDANPDKAMQVGFELLLARVECYHFLELLEKDQLGPQEWLEVLQRRLGHKKVEEPTEKKTTEPKEEEIMKKEEAERKKVPPYLDNGLAANPKPKPRRGQLISVDPSIVEMQNTYPDLAFRGRLLAPDKPHQANTSRNSSKDVQTASDDSKAAELHKRDGVKGTRATALKVCSKNSGSKAEEALGDNSKSCHDRNSVGTTLPGNNTSSSTDGSGVNELSGPQAISLHITLRTGSKAEKSLKPGEPQLTAEPLSWTQYRAAADAQNNSLAKTELSPLSSVDEEQELRELAQRMGQSHEAREEVKRKEEHNKGGENANTEQRKKWRKASTERELEEQSLRKPVMETGPVLSRDTSRCTRSFQSDPTVMKEQKQPNKAITTADCESCKRGGCTGQREDDDPGRAHTGREEEQLAHSFVIIESHKK